MRFAVHTYTEQFIERLRSGGVDLDGVQFELVGPEQS